MISNPPESDTTSAAIQPQPYKGFDLGTEANKEITNQDLDALRQAVFAKQKNLDQLYQEIGDMTVYNYYRTHTRENRNKIIKLRKAESIPVIQEEVRKVLGSKISESVARQLKDNDGIATVQHHAPIGHPDTLNAVLAGALPYFGSNNPEHQNLIVFACAGVSFNNSKFPRGHLFHTLTDGRLDTNQLTFFGQTVAARPVMYHHGYDYEDIRSIKNVLIQYKRDGLVNDEFFEKIATLIEDLYTPPHPLSVDDYVDQLTITNYWFFKKLFKNYRKSVPNLVFIAQEKVALSLILKHHIERETPIYKMMFNPAILDLVETYFEGISGAFSKKDEAGTFLFWGLPKHGKYRVQLWRNGNFLEDKEGVFKIELTPESIKNAILNKELIPSVMLTFAILACYYGYSLGGGHLQTRYLVQMKEAYAKIVDAIGDTESREALEGLVTSNFIIPRPTLVYIKSGNKRVPATGMDMLLYGDGGENFQTIIEASKRITMKQVIDRILPGLFRDLNLSDEKLSKITEREIEELNGLSRNLPEVITL